MLNVVKIKDDSQIINEVGSMFRDRKRVFVDILKWDIPYNDFMERDEFDNEHAEYLIVSDPENKNHLGSVRLLRTDRPHILGDIFPELCDVPVPRDPSIREITRLCLSPRLRASQRLEVRNRLATALVEYALLMDISSYTGVAEMGWLSQILALGWHCSPLGIPKPVGKTLLGSLQIHIAPNTINLLRRAGTYATSGLTLDRHTLGA